MAATNTMSSTAPVQRGVMGSKREMPASSGLAANTTSTPRGKRISRGKSTALTPSATHTRKMAPPNTVPKATGAEPLAPAASPTATFSTSKPDRTAPTAKAESRSATDRPTNPSKSRSVAQIASKTPMTNMMIPSKADIISPNMLFLSLGDLHHTRPLKYFYPAVFFVEMPSLLLCLLTRHIGEEVAHQGLFGMEMTQIV